MNCEKVNFLLDSKSAAELTAVERQAVNRHFASCDECREIWDAYGELAALTVPATPPYLRVRIALALAAHAARKLHVRRGLFVGVVLLAAAAAAATAVLQLTSRSPDPVPTLEEVAPAVQPIVPPTPEAPAPSDAPVPSSPEPVEPSAASEAGRYPLDPHSLVVIGLQTPGAETEAAAALATCYDTVVERLRAAGGLNVIAGESLRSVADRPQPEFRVARELGASSALLLIGDSPPSCFAAAWNVEAKTSETIGFGWKPDDWRAFADAIAASTREWILKDAATLAAERRAAVLDPTLGDHARLDALWQLRWGPPLPTTFDEASVAVAVQIGMTSPDVSARRKAWQVLRGETDPYIVAPLLNALETDREAFVRAEAALALAAFADQPIVKDALTRAAAEVPTQAPELCCGFTVRAAARQALRVGGDPIEAVRGTVLDESLTPQERLSLDRSDGGSTTLDELGAAATRAVFALGSSAEDDRVRARAWSLLSNVEGEPGFILPLLEDLARHPAEIVRAGAAAGLTPHRGEPRVRAALERAQADPSLRVRQAAQRALDGLAIPY